MRSTIINKYTQVFPDKLGPSEKKICWKKLEKRLTQFNEYLQACRNIIHKPNFSKHLLENQCPINTTGNTM